MNSKVNNFRNDIQSLRGISIILVLFFHFYPNILPRGYLGVDIFFVISGYLISKILTESIQPKKQLLKNFYIKRIKRIFPSLSIVIFVTYILSIFILLPEARENLNQSIISTYLLIPNIFFWLKGGYFGLIDELKPLLHLWSIGVELQFYILFPIIYVLIKKLFKFNKIKLIIFLLAISSIILNIYINYIDGNNVSFFMFPTRFWEFGIGCLAFFYFNDKYLKFFKSNYIQIISLLFFLYILFIGSKNQIINQLGTVFFAFNIIYTNKKINLFSRVLNSKILIFFGFVSYSLYLWHWPILSLYKYFSVIELSFIEKNLILILSIILSFISSKFIENNFRFKYSLKKNLIFFVAIILIILTTNFTNIKHPKKNNINYLSAIKISKSIGSNFRCKINEYIIYGSSKACLINTKENNIKGKLIALYGNSHAQMYGFAFKNVLKKIDKSGIIIPLNACLPTYKYNINLDCLKKSKNNFNKIIFDNKIETIILGLNYNHKYIVDYKGFKIYKNVNQILTNSIKDLISEFLENGKNVILLGPLSEPGYNFPLDYARKLYFEKNIKLSTSNKKNIFEEQNKEFLDFSEIKSENFYHALPHKVQCKDNECSFILQNESFFADNNHLSKFGSLKMKDMILNSILLFKK